MIYYQQKGSVLEYLTDETDDLDAFRALSYVIEAGKIGSFIGVKACIDCDKRKGIERKIVIREMVNELNAVTLMGGK